MTLVWASSRQLPCLLPYLLVKSLSLFDVFLVTMVRSHIRIVQRVRWTANHDSLVQISTTVRLVVYFPIPA